MQFADYWFVRSHAQIGPGKSLFNRPIDKFEIAYARSLTPITISLLIGTSGSADGADPRYGNFPAKWLSNATDHVGRRLSWTAWPIHALQARYAD